MDLKNSSAQKHISKIFRTAKDKTSESLAGSSLKGKIAAFVKREKAIWNEFDYAEKLARMVETWDGMNTRRIFAAGGVVIAVCMGIFTYRVATAPNALLLEINGAEIGFVESQEIVDETVLSLEEDLAASLGVAEVRIDDGVVTCTATRQKKLKLMEPKEIEDSILEADVCKVDAWNIEINGASVVTAATEEAANQILEGVVNNYKTPGAEVIDYNYKEDVQIVPTTVGVDDITDVAKATAFILTGQEEPQTYTVQAGDTLWDIAYANGMKPAELVAANPDFEADRLKIGQVLNLVATKPYMTVSITEKVTANEVIPFNTEYKDDKSLLRGKTKVITAGVNGQKEVVSQIVTENGKTVSAAVLSEKVLSEPVTQVASRGTKVPVYTASANANVKGSGVLGRPLSSIVPSKNGGLYGASRGGRRHVGVDLRSSKGAPIYAADGGTVTKVSSSGSYGKLIVVNHGNGLVTKYAHCNSIDVSAGQTVSKGQQIGTVGNTGNATGYILHFEVLVNGSNVNPLNYL